MALGLGLGLQFKNGLKAQPFNGLFDQFGYPAFGASMRLLGKNYTGGLVRVRAFDGSSDQGTADVMPYKIGDERWADLNSTLKNLDATAIGRGLTTSDTLGDLLSSGVNDYDGFVTTWFDQSGNANDATQATAASQPQIASAGSLILENGKPAVEIPVSSSTFLNLNSNINVDTAFTVGRIFSLNTVNYIFWSDTNNSGMFYGATAAGINGLGIFDGTNILDTGNESAIQKLGYINKQGGNYSVAENGGTLSTSLIGQIQMDTISRNGLSISYRGNMQEIISYSSDKSTDRTSMESQINNAFTIFP